MTPAKTGLKYFGDVFCIPWTDKVKNTEMLDQMGKEMQMVFEKKHRKVFYFDHVVCNEKYRLLQLFIKGKIEGAGEAEERPLGSRIYKTGLS